MSEHDELDERLDEREHAERQRHVPTSSADPSRTESDRHQKETRILTTMEQEPYVEPVQIFPILYEPKLDATRTRGINEELVSKAMKTEMESFRKFDVFDEVDIDDLSPEERSEIIGGRWVLTPKSGKIVLKRR